MDLGILISDVPRSWGPRKQLDALLRQVDAAQRNGFTYLAIGQHFLYGDLTWLQPVPVLARLAGEVDINVRLATTIIVSPLYDPILLAEELATLDIVTEGRLIFGCALGYRPEEFEYFRVPFKQRVSRFEESLELMRAIWTQDRVDHRGRHFQLTDAEPHIRPWQSPHPPIWLGGFSEPAIKRAGRLGEKWTIPPEPEVDEIKSRLVVFRAEQEKRGREMSHQPLRRNVFVAETRAAAEAEFIRASRQRYLIYAQRGLDVLDRAELERDFVATAGRHAVLGTPDEVIGELTRIAHAVPVNPIMIRPGWPSLEPDEVVACLDRFGSDVVPALRQVTPCDLNADAGAGSPAERA